MTKKITSEDIKSDISQSLDYIYTEEDRDDRFSHVCEVKELLEAFELKLIDELKEEFGF